MSVHRIPSAPTYAPSALARGVFTSKNWIDLEDAIRTDWKSVAKKLNMEKKAIKWCQTQRDPPHEMIRTWRLGSDATVERLAQGLRDAGATKALKVFIVSDITQTPVTAATTVAPLVHAAASSALPVALPTAALSGHVSSANILTPEDLFNAECALLGDGPRSWLRVGSNLGFKESQLDYFETQDSPPREMIESWLGNTHAGSLNALITVCDDIGNDAAASVFRAALARAPMEITPGQ